jgi:hypothetical protein
MKHNVSGNTLGVALDMKRHVLVPVVLILQGALAFAEFLGTQAGHGDATQLHILVAKHKKLSFVESANAGMPFNFNKTINKKEKKLLPKQVTVLQKYNVCNSACKLNVLTFLLCFLNVLMPFIIMIFIVNYPLMITFTF